MIKAQTVPSCVGRPSSVSSLSGDADYTTASGTFALRAPTILATCETPEMPILLLPTAPTTPATNVPWPLSSYGSPLVDPSTKLAPKMSSTMPAGRCAWLSSRETCAAVVRDHVLSKQEALAWRRSAALTREFKQFERFGSSHEGVLPVDR